LKKLKFGLMSLAILFCLVIATGAKSKPKKTLGPKYFQKGQSALEIRDYKVAAGWFDNAIEEDPRMADAWNMLGFTYRSWAVSLLDKAGGAYAKAVSISPNHEEALEYQGEFFLLRGQLVNAYRNYEELAKLGSPEAEELKAKLDKILEEAAVILEEEEEEEEEESEPDL